MRPRLRPHGRGKDRQQIALWPHVANMLVTRGMATKPSHPHHPTPLAQIPVCRGLATNPSIKTECHMATHQPYPLEPTPAPCLCSPRNARSLGKSNQRACWHQVDATAVCDYDYASCLAVAYTICHMWTRLFPASSHPLSQIGGHIVPLVHVAFQSLAVQNRERRQAALGTTNLQKAILSVCVCVCE